MAGGTYTAAIEAGLALQARSRALDKEFAGGFGRSEVVRKEGALPLAPADELKVAGLTPFTTIDFPGRLAAVIFCRGCPLRCSYCHNAAMRCMSAQSGDLSWERVRAFLEGRKGRLEAVVFSGGEPLIQSPLFDAMREVRAQGYLVGLHTAGTSPDRLRKALPHADWVGFDVKTAFEDYEGGITGVPGSGLKARRSLEILIDSGVPYEVRTTADPLLVPFDRLAQMAGEISAMGVRTFRIQEPTGSGERYAPWMEEQIGSLFADFTVRRNTGGAQGSGSV